MASTIIINEGTYASPASLGVGRSAIHALLTFADAINFGVSFLRGHGKEASQEDIRYAVQSAYTDIINGHNWLSLEGPERIHLHAAQKTGTVTYTASNRQLILSGATWPSWVENASVLLNDIICEVETYISPSTILLHETLNPGADIAAGSTYKLFCRWYPLPAGFVNFTGPMGRQGWAYGQPITMTEMTAYQRNYWSTGTIRYYAIGERPNYPAEKAIYIWPFASISEPLNFTYQRRPRELQYSGKDASDSDGTITTVEGSNAIAGTNTSFDEGMAGAVLMVGRNGTKLPTGRYGLNRFAEQLRIHSVTSAIALATTSNAMTSRSAVKYVITDPIEIETCARNAFVSYVKMHLADIGGLDEADSYIAKAEKAMRDAMAASYPVQYDPSQSHVGDNWLSGTVDWDKFGG